MAKFLISFFIVLGCSIVSSILPVQCLSEKTAPIGEPPFFFSVAGAAPWSSWFSSGPTDLSFDEMYSSASSMGLVFSDKIQGLEGQRVAMTGFMAPPLKPTLSFFVLTQVPMSICPFCSTDADWPSNIVVGKLDEPVTALPFDQPIRVVGTLELGSQLDEETGFVSLVRIRAEELSLAN